MVLEDEFVRHKDLYYADGSVVLLAAHAGKTHAFRVHKSVLASHSKVFADMFVLPSTAENETYDGIDSVQMPDDAKDLEDLLRALYYPGTILSMLENRNPLAATKYKGILLLSQKYFVRVLQKLLRARFRADWPSTLPEWDRLMEHYASLSASIIPQHDAASQFIDNRMLEPASAIRLAREANIPEILPAAFYMLSTITQTPLHSLILKGTVLLWQPGERSARWGLLTPDDWLCLARGRHCMTDFAQTFEAQESQCICDSQNCIQLDSKRKLLKGPPQDFLRVLKEIGSQKTLQQYPCYNSLQALASRSLETRSVLWDNLGYYFGLPEVVDDQNDGDSDDIALVESEFIDG
ncbi:uncharacterized protein F5891DRAFT_1138196 [Suillus fuscotomentosus]|uniref:BTB domain-containing protein n=1 Tax=Suillus fuscotomentosus TaxID=1912939 RepID=A0AAD4EG88_9AGAM|nr:uncharacterized protein F5891DRAFT_1138196 [Suillus fuscotomentosus]KAG1905585.1 hypothetical protein F5891DRAFT_1138196 [Suillus fuscotomentosus]